MLHNPNAEKTVSNYDPPQEVKEFTLYVTKDYAIGYNIQHRIFREFNDMSVLERDDISQKAFNSYVEPRSTDPDESWRWPGVRPITRNKCISIAAHVTARLLYPNVFAQNAEDIEDKEAAMLLRDMLEWNGRNSDYELANLYGAIAALVNSVAYLNPEFAEVTQKIKIKHEGGFHYDEVLDDVLSGLQTHNVPADEVLIANPYGFHLQRQRFMIRRRFIDYDESEALHGDHPNYSFVLPGIRTFYEEETGIFYQQRDQELETLAEETRYYNRRNDTEAVFVNGIYMGDANTEENPMKHRDNMLRPKYPFVKYGFEPIDERRFYFYKSLAFKMSGDQELVDIMHRIAVDGSWLDSMPPSTAIGAKIDSSVMVPGSVTSLPLGAELKTIGPNRNLTGVIQMLDRTEKALTEESQSEIARGIQEKGVETKYEVQRLEENARIALGVFGKQLAGSVRDLGDLMIDLIITHQTVGELSEVAQGEEGIMKYQTFLLPDQVVEGKKITKKIRFTDRFMGRELTEEERMLESLRVYEEEGGDGGETRIYEANPLMFSKLKVLVYVDATVFPPLNEEFEKAIKLEAYDRMIENPYVDQEAITRDFLVDTLAKGKTDKYMKKREEIMAMVGAEPPIGKARKPQGPQVVNRVVNRRAAAAEIV